MTPGKLAAAIVGAGLALVLVEGTLSLSGARSLRTLFRRPSRFGEAPAEVAPGAAPASPPAGEFRVHPDPLIGYVMAPGFELANLGAPIRLDEHGLRRRPGPPPGAGATRLVFLGDSVAFGLGLADEDVLAAQVERDLNAARASGPGVVGLTVAVPSWNYRNAVRYLLDDLARIDPDVVLYMPVENDLEDSFGPTEAGLRRELYDPAVPAPLLRFRFPRAYLVFHLKSNKAASAEEEERCGPELSLVGLTASSRWRLADMARSLIELQTRLQRVGARLVLLAHEQHDLQRQLRATLARLGAEIQAIPLLDEMQRSDTLGHDPHPSAETTAAFAAWTAAELVERGWVSGVERADLAEAPSSYRERRARELEPAELLAWSEELARTSEQALRPMLEPATFTGLCQIYGGINLDSTLGVEFAAVLPRGEELEVELAPIEARPDLYPLLVRVFADEVELGTVTVSANTSAQRFVLPGTARERAFELRLRAEDWCTLGASGKSWIASARLVRVRSSSR